MTERERQLVLEHARRQHKFVMQCPACRLHLRGKKPTLRVLPGGTP